MGGRINSRPDQLVDVYADGHKIELHTESFTRLRYVDRYASSDIERKDYPANNIMNRTDHDNSQRLSFREYYESYVKTFDLTDKQLNELKIDKIKIIIQGKEYKLTDITFTRDSGFYLYPLNC